MVPAPLVIESFGAFSLIRGDKVNGLAVQIALGGGYDWFVGGYVSPALGVFYQNWYVRYYPTMGIGMAGVRLIHQFEIGRSFFLGSRGKPVVEFR